MAPRPKVLFILTSADKMSSGKATGWYLPEAAHPYYELLQQVDIDFAAPGGPNPPLDQNSVKMFANDDGSTKFLHDEVVKEKLANALYLKDVKADDYDAIFYVGGHGPVIDLAIDPVNIKLAEEVYAKGKIVSAVCHGPAAIVNVKDPNGKSIFAGKDAVSFTNDEEEAAGYKAPDDIPFLVESTIVEKGGNFVKADKFQPKVIVSGNLITGQNPASAGPLGKALLEALTSKA